MKSSESPIEDVSKFEIRDTIDELDHQVTHLKRSQVELQEALLEEPEDEDFKQAYTENEEVISSRLQKIFSLKQYLKRIDIAYYMEHYGKDGSGENSVCVSTEASASIEVSLPVQTQVQAIPIEIVSDNTSSGIYL
jgi:preprotein translocase subunit SecA